MADINLQKIINVKGKSGLFHLYAYNPRGYHLQPFGGGPVTFVSNEKMKVLALGNVDLKLKEGSVNLMEIFIRMRKKLPQGEISAEATRQYFLQLVPELDDAVATSHLQKVLHWFEQIHQEFEPGELVNEQDDGLTIT